MGKKEKAKQLKNIEIEYSPSACAIHPNVLIVSPGKYRWFREFYDEINREDANGRLCT